MGDVAMFVPVLQALLAQNPHVQITVLTDPFLAPIFKDFETIRIHTIDKKGNHKGVLGLWRLSRELKKEKVTEIADIHNVLRSKILRFFFLGKKAEVIDKGRKEKRELTSGKSFQALKSTHERYADVFRNLGFSVDINEVSPLKKRKLPKTIQRKIDEKKFQKIIGIAPFAAHNGKAYNLDQMKEVVAALSADYTIFLFGAPQEKSHLESLVSNINTFIIAGEFSFKEELTIISNLDVMISMDSGNGHLAANYGVKVVTIWGVTHPYAGFAPFRQPANYSLLPDRKIFPKIPTSIFGKTYPEGYENAASSISPEKIIDKVKSII